ncbi:MAG TPA: NapC/NirT family cytochrome c, partial [Bacteroidales bacterium]|nr:NapC/NirT family cytochrome c [Bacteroidales bacterium]
MKKFLKWFFPGLLVGLLIYWGFEKALVLTSTNSFCMSCHIHPEADNSWKRSTHYETRSGYRIACVECHLPPKG